MEFIRLFIVYFLLMCLPNLATAQTPYQDSLFNAYQTEPDDRRFQTLVRYCFNIMHTDTVKTNNLIDQAFSALESSDLPIEKQYFYKGQLYEVKAHMAGSDGDNTSRLNYYQKCLELSQLIPGKDGATLKGIAHFGFATGFGMQGLFQKSNTELKSAGAAFEKAEKIGKLCDVYAQMCQNYHQLMEYDSALYFINKSLDLQDWRKDITGVAYSIFFKANTLNQLNLPDSTINLLKDQYLDEIKQRRPQLYAHLIMAKADAYSDKKLFEQAGQLLEVARSIVDESSDTQLKYNYLYSKMNIEKDRDDYKAAYAALEEFYTLRDTLHQQSTRQRYMELQNRYDAQSKDFEISTLKRETNYQRNLMLVGGSLFALTLLSLFFWYRNREQKRNAIQSKNNQQIRISFKYDEPQIEDEFLDKVSSIIHDNIGKDDFTVEKLVQLSGLNRSKLNNGLKERIGKTAGKLIREIRFEKAKFLLSTANKNVSEVAFELGFKDPNYFSTSFKDYFGYPPSDLKKAN